MRNFIKVIESAGKTLYHGSRVEFSVGDILTPQEEGYVNHPDADPAHILTEKVIEDHRLLLAPRR